MIRQTMVQLTDDLVRLLDEEASRRGTSRSALIREAVLAHLSASEAALQSRQIVEGYRRIPPGTPDGWADLEAMQDVSLKETMQRMSEEEERSGHDPW
jgi:predicted transcriptional regulator